LDKSIYNFKNWVHCYNLATIDTYSNDLISRKMLVAKRDENEGVSANLLQKESFSLLPVEGLLDQDAGLRSGATN
jgi:hypothetical protein